RLGEPPVRTLAALQVRDPGVRHAHETVTFGCPSGVCGVRHAHESATREYGEGPHAQTTSVLSRRAWRPSRRRSSGPIARARATLPVACAAPTQLPRATRAARGCQDR